jgi:hypothetical protein
MFPSPVLSLCISEMEGRFLSGFLEGECSLGIAENNGGQSMTCFVRVCVRADDVELIEWLAAATGVGTLRRVPARATSKPQVAWTVYRRDDCREVAALLRRFPFFGRKRRELAIWSLALAEHETATPNALRRLKASLEEARRFGPAAPLEGPPPAVTALKGYITGFVAAEGHLGLYDGRPRLAVHLRGDDRPLLDMLCRETGCGAVCDCAAVPPLNPSCVWVVSRGDQLERLVDWFYEADMYGRKRGELDAWAVAVGERCAARAQARKPDPSVIATAARCLAEARAYRPPAPRDWHRPDRRATGRALLQRWADEEARPLSCESYMRWRAGRPDAPTRNTIVHWFGSWHTALAAADLEHRAAGGSAAQEARRAGAEPGLRRRREAQRRRALAALARCRDDLGRTPRVLDYQRWRLRPGVDAPTHATFYRLFEGGWKGVLAALG